MGIDVPGRRSREGRGDIHALAAVEELCRERELTGIVQRTVVAEIRHDGPVERLARFDHGVGYGIGPGENSNAAGILRAKNATWPESFSPGRVRLTVGGEGLNSKLIKVEEVSAIVRMTPPLCRKTPRRPLSNAPRKATAPVLLTDMPSAK